VLPVEDDVRELALEVNEVDRSLSHDLVGETVVAVPRIAGLRPFHANIVAHALWCGKVCMVRCPAPGESMRESSMMPGVSLYARNATRLA
jgi:hypothetical protein